MRRFFEILPGALAWTTLLGMVFFSWRFPFWVAIFIILFDVYWFFKTIYLALHLRLTFLRMKENLKTKWLDLLTSNRYERAEGAPEWGEIYHLVVFPMSYEPYEVVRESFIRLTGCKVCRI